MEREEQKNVSKTNFTRCMTEGRIEKYDEARAIARMFYSELTKEDVPEFGLDSPDGRFKVRVKRRHDQDREWFDVIGYKRIEKNKKEKKGSSQKKV